MMEALKETLRARAVEALVEAAHNLALSLALNARAAGVRRVNIRARVAPVRYKGLRQRRATMAQRAGWALNAAKQFAAVATVAGGAKGVG